MPKKSPASVAEVKEAVKAAKEKALPEVAETTLATIQPKPDDFVVTTTHKQIESIKSEAVKMTLAGVDLIDGRVVVVDPDAMLADKDGLKALKEFRMRVVVKQRTACDKEHEKLKADAWAECKRLDLWKREMLALIAPIETTLEKIENAVEEELDRRAKVRADLQYAARKQALIDLGANEDEIDEASIRRMDDDAFHRHGNMISAAKARAFALEQEALRIQEAQRVEAEKLAAERLAFEEQRKEVERLAQIERDRLASEQAEAARLTKIESDKIAAHQADQARILKEQQEEFEKRQQVERDRLAKERADHDRQVAEEREFIRKQNELEQKKLSDAQERIRSQQEELDNQARIQREAAEQAERDRIAAETPEVAETKNLEPESWGTSEPEPWSMIAAKEICEWINVAPIDREDIEQVSEIILSAYSERIE